MILKAKTFVAFSSGRLSYKREQELTELIGLNRQNTGFCAYGDLRYRNASSIFLQRERLDYILQLSEEPFDLQARRTQ